MHEFDGSASLAERDERPEDRVFRESDEKLYRTVPRDHRLNEEAAEASGGVCGPHALEHCRRFLTDPVGMAEIEHNAANIALVRDIGRTDLQRDREPDIRGDGSGPVRIPGSVIGDDRDAISRQYRARLFRIEPGFPSGECH